MVRSFLLLSTLLGLSLGAQYDRVVCTPGDETIYQFSEDLLDGSATVDFTDYTGTVLLIYNVATYTNVTVQNYNQANALADNYVDQAFQILAFPSSEFGKGEPGSGYDEILNGIQHVRPGGGFEPKMTFFKVTQINGNLNSALYKFLKSQCSYVNDEFDEDIFYSPQNIEDVRWNFEKFLIGKDGKPYFRYHPNVFDPEALIPDIDALLAAQ